MGGWSCESYDFEGILTKKNASRQEDAQDKSRYMHAKLESHLYLVSYLQRNDKVITRPSLFRLPNGDAGFNMSSLCHLLWFCPI